MIRRTLGSSAEIRVLPFARELEKRGVSCEFLNPPQNYYLNPFNQFLFPTDFRDFLDLLANKKGEFDVLFLSRVSSIFVYLIQKRAYSKVIFDLDDPLFLPSRKIGNFEVRSPAFACIERVMRNSEAVTASSHFILALSKNFNPATFLIHTPIDVETFAPSIMKKSEKFTIGWVGNASGSLENLEMIREPLLKIGKQYDIRFKLVSYLGDERVKNAFRRIEDYVEVDYGLKRWIPLSKMAEHVCDFDVFVSPFTKTPWFEGKSVVKVGIGMAMGIPVIASPVGEQKFVIKHGVNGFLAKTEEEWYKYLKMLIEDENLRDSIGASGRKTVEREMSFHVCGKKLFDVINAVIR